MMRFFALCLLFVLVLGPIAVTAEEPMAGPEVWVEGEPTPQSVIDILGFDPATVPDAPPEPSAAEQAILDKAQAAYDAGNFKAAHDLWLPLAEAGVAEAQYRVGGLYGRAEGVAKDIKTELFWYRKASIQGLTRAIYNTGVVFFIEEDGGVQNFLVSTPLFFEAASRGDVDARINLGLSYLGGRGTPRNMIEGYKWLYLAGDEAEDVRTNFIVFTTEAQREAGRIAASQYEQ